MATWVALSFFMIKVFCLGAGTYAKYRGDGNPTLVPGEGKFLEPSFSSKAEASHFCQELLKNNPDAVYYLMDADQIVGFEYNRKYKESQERRRQEAWARISWTTFFGLFALMIDCTTFFEFSTAFQLCFIYIIETLSFLIFLLFMDLEILLSMFIMMVLVWITALGFVVHLHKIAHHNG